MGYNWAKKKNEEDIFNYGIGRLLGHFVCTTRSKMS